MSTRKRGKRWLGGIVAGLVVIGAATGAYFGLSPSAAGESDPTVMTRDATASLTTLARTVGASGTMEPAQESSLAFTSAGTVTSVSVAVGDKVSAGQVLARIDPTELQSAVEAAQASVDAAQDDLEAAQDDGTDAAVNAATSTLKTKQNALEQANAALAGATLTAPFDGTVAAVEVSLGQTISSSGAGALNGGGSSTAAVTVITADRYLVSVGVGSADIGQITKGMKAQVTPAGASQPLDGTVSGVGVVASTSSGSSTASFPVTITLDQAQTDLYAGISASVSIITSSREKVLVVPTQAITLGADGRATVDKKQPDDTYLATTVTTGEVSGTQTEILAGLAEGDTVRLSIVIPSNSDSSGGGPSFAGSGDFPAGPDGGGIFSDPMGGQGIPVQIQSGERP